MSSELSPYAIHRIVYFAENDDRRARQVKKPTARTIRHYLRGVNDKWNYVYTHYFLDNRPQPLDYLRSLELALFLRKGLDSAAMRTVFEHGKPLVFDRDLPRLLVPAIVEAFERLNEDPPFLDVTLSPPFSIPRLDISLLWPQVYVYHLPCGTCTKLEQEQIVEKFHFPSTHSDKQLTVELHFSLQDRAEYGDAVRPATAPALEKNVLRQITIQLGNLPCNKSRSGKIRVGQSLLLTPDFTSEIYGFLDRAHVGTSLLANNALNALIMQLKNRLPVHLLGCEFEKNFLDPSKPDWRRVFYWMVLRHFRSDLAYSDLRRFKVPLEAGPAVNCALVIRYLSNSHLFAFETPHFYPRFTFKMLAALADRNCSVGALRTCVDGRLSDYRSMDAVFKGRMRLATLQLRLFEHEFVTLVKTTNFFRMSTVQRLRVLKLQLIEPWVTSQEPRRWAIVNSPLWIAGIHRLRNCEHFEVKYDSDGHLRKIGRMLVQLCEKFERGQIVELVQHFKFATGRRVTFRFKNANKTDSRVDGDYEWNTYRFRNAANGEWLTACVGHELCEDPRYSVLHIVKGEVYPDASFAA